MRFRAIWMLTLAMGVAACGGGGIENPPDGTIRALHAAPSFGVINFLRVERVEAQLPFKGDSGFLTVDQDQYNFHLEVLNPGASDPTRLLRFAQSITAGQEYTFVIAESAGGLEVITLENEAGVAGDTEALVDMINLSATAGPVDVYLAAPGVAPSGAPLATLNLRDQIDGASAAEGDYQLTLTQPGDPAAVLFTSGNFTLPGGSRALLTVVDNAGGTTAPFSVLALSDAVVSGELFDTDVQGAMRVIHGAPSAGQLDFIVDDDFAAPFAPAVSAETVSDYQTITRGTRNLKITPTGNMGSIEIDQDLVVSQGNFITVLAGGSAGALQAASAVDENRPIAGVARVRLMGAQEQEGNINLYIVPPGTDVSEQTPTLGGLPFMGISEYVDFQPGDYELVATDFDSDEVIGTPTAITLVGGTAYGVLILDDPTNRVRALLFDGFNPL